MVVSSSHPNTGCGYSNPLRLRILADVCRSIKTLRGAEPPAGEDEIRAAALQFVRKVSGYRAPSQANRAAFDGAVDDVTEATERLLASLTGTPAGARSSPAHG